MEDYQLRVVAEQKDLTEKLVKLVAFIAENPSFAVLHRVEQDRIEQDRIEQDRMRRQRDAMIAYSDALGDRIADFRFRQTVRK